MILTEQAAHEKVESDAAKNDREFKFLLDKIMRNRNIDFCQYRPEVLKRRIRHRLHQTECAAYMDYVMLLNRDPEEYDRLIECLTIKVSEFFRDARVFSLLGDMIIPEIVVRKHDQGSRVIRAWSCGTAYGQEAYSMAILFCEVLGGNLKDFDLRILATDIDRNALEQAPWGSYDQESLRKLSPHLLFKYFTRFGDRYMVSDRAKSLVTFKYSDIVSGNAISGVDLVLCRNLLIYFEKEQQEKTLHNLFAALAPGGFLVLGKTETLPPQVFDRFEVVDLRERIYRKRMPTKQKKEECKMAKMRATSA